MVTNPGVIPRNEGSRSEFAYVRGETRFLALARNDTFAAVGLRTAVGGGAFDDSSLARERVGLSGHDEVVAV